MAIIRCEKCGKPREIKRHYVGSVKPIGYPDTAAICGRLGCNNPGLVWLDDDDWKAYEAGERIFQVMTHTIKVKVQ